MDKHKYLKGQKGFTLVEIAIVLVIIGLLIGGVLKGQAMIQNAKVKRLVKDIEGIRTAVIAFQDRYGMLPGDENSATLPPSDTTNGNRDGWITAAEQPMQDLYCAGLVGGTGTALPANAFGGTINVFAQTLGTGTFNYIVTTLVPTDACQEIDTKYDDGIWNTGIVRGNADYYTPAGNTTSYTLSQRL